MHMLRKEQNQMFQGNDSTESYPDQLVGKFHISTIKVLLLAGPTFTVLILCYMIYF